MARPTRNAQRVADRRDPGRYRFHTRDDAYRTFPMATYRVWDGAPGAGATADRGGVPEAMHRHRAGGHEISRALVLAKPRAAALL